MLFSWLSRRYRSVKVLLQSLSVSYYNYLRSWYVWKGIFGEDPYVCKTIEGADVWNENNEERAEVRGVLHCVSEFVFMSNVIRGFM